ncbi:MAG: diguanylate cyclase [Polyangiaceae bacterium]
MHDTHPITTSPLSILVAEDDDDMRENIRDALVSLGHECTLAKDGEEALALHRASRHDVILSDWHMPRMSGVELCRHTRALDAGGRYTYFILLSAFGDREHFVQGMEAGADDYSTKPFHLHELRARLGSAARVVSLYRKLAEQNRDLRRESQNSFREARIDALTGVANRLRLTEDLDVVRSRAERYGHRFSAAICDIDHFKSYNDRFGHLEGDVVLRRVADAIRAGLRESDTLYRYGGEEFLVVLPEQAERDAVLVLDRVRLRVEGLGIPNADERPVTLSVGVAEFRVGSENEENVVAWLKRADDALYEAKGRGRNRVVADGARNSGGVSHHFV